MLMGQREEWGGGEGGVTSLWPYRTGRGEVRQEESYGVGVNG